jgi:isopenicillin N synthase-like dioxygenase
LVKSIFSKEETKNLKKKGFLAQAIEIQPTKFLELCDPLPLKEGTYATSMLHFFRYFEKPKTPDSLGCVEHTDSGLITIIPVAEEPGLELLSWKDFSWNPVEKIKLPNQTAPILSVLVGETLSFLTNRYFQATVHKVVFENQERYSTPFQLRANPNAWLDPQTFENKIIKFQGKFPAIQVKDFIQ